VCGQASSKYFGCLCLVALWSTTQEHCSVDEFTNAENEISVCENVFSETWEAEFLARIGDGRNEQLGVNDDDDNNDIEEDDMGDVEIISKDKTYPEAEYWKILLSF